MTAARIMPERLFFGSAANSNISGLLDDFSGYRRPLAPGERYLGAFIVPPFQRGLVWTESQKVRLIESLYLGLPVGSIVWNSTPFSNQCDRWLLDGQQRTTAILDFVAGAFRVNGWLFPDLPEIERRHFKRLSIPVVETNIQDAVLCEDVYNRLVYGGTPHQQA